MTRKVLIAMVAAITTLAIVAQSTRSGSVLSPQSSVLSHSSVLLSQTREQAEAKSPGCVNCHRGIEPMHTSPAVHLGCTDCHGGNATATTKDAAHVKPLHPETWKTSANPPRTYTAL